MPGTSFIKLYTRLPFDGHQSLHGFVVVEHENGKWGLPGGFHEPGETPLAAGIRELEEELGPFPHMDPGLIHSLLLEGLKKHPDRFLYYSEIPDSSWSGNWRTDWKQITDSFKKRTTPAETKSVGFAVKHRAKWVVYTRKGGHLHQIHDAMRQGSYSALNHVGV